MKISWKGGIFILCKIVRDHDNHSVFSRDYQLMKFWYDKKYYLFCRGLNYVMVRNIIFFEGSSGMILNIIFFSRCLNSWKDHENVEYLFCAK